MLMNIHTSAQENTAKRDPRRRRFKAISTTLTVVVIVAVILLNVIVSALADRYPLSFDMSSDKTYTLSEESKQVAETVKNDVEIVIFADVQNYFISIAQTLYQQYYMYYGQEVDLSNQLERLSREIETALAQLKSGSDEKITYTFVDPDQEPEKYAQYNKYNMGNNNVLFISGERYRKTSLESMMDIGSDLATVTSNVEKVLISNIFALQEDNDHIIQVLTGHAEDENTIYSLQRLYELNGYAFEELVITGSAAFNEDAEMLLIAAPATDYSANEIERIRTWLKNDNQRNRHLMVYVNSTADCPNLYEMLKTDFHIEVTDQIIHEANPDRYISYDGQYDDSMIYADVPSTDYTDNSNGDATVLLYRARRLICDLPSENENNGIAELGIPLTTHPDTAWVNAIGSDSGKVTLESDQFPLTSAVSYVYETFDDNTQQSATTTVTVCGSSYLPQLAQSSGAQNEEWLLDVIHSVSGYKTDILISNKVIANDVTDFTSGTQIVLGIWVFTIGIPLVVLIVCLVVFLRRRSL